MENHQLNEIFLRQTSETECEIDRYSDRLSAAVESLSHCQPAVVSESQLWSKLAAIQSGGTVYSAKEWEAETADGDPLDLGGAWIAYYWNREAEEWDLAFVATWPESEED